VAQTIDLLGIDLGEFVAKPDGWQTSTG